MMVANSRSTAERSQIWRRRRCLACKSVFTTYERVDLSHLVVVKKSGRRERFKRAKLFSGIYHSSIRKKNSDRGEMSEFAQTITNLAEEKIIHLRKKEISSQEITEIVLRLLKKKDPGVFLQFLAYREGSDRKRVNRFIRKYF